MSNNSLLSIDWTLSGATTQGQSGPGSNGNEKTIHILQKSWTGASPLDIQDRYLDNMRQLRDR